MNSGRLCKQLNHFIVLNAGRPAERAAKLEARVNDDGEVARDRTGHVRYFFITERVVGSQCGGFIGNAQNILPEVVYRWRDGAQLRGKFVYVGDPQVS